MTNLVKTSKLNENPESKKQQWGLAFYIPTIEELNININGMNSDEFASLAIQCGAKTSINVNLLDDNIEASVIKISGPMKNNQVKRCLVLPEHQISSHTWTTICNKLERTEMLRYLLQSCNMCSIT